jgi:FKBP-type peptidyl-prolyl cis-trans isomerase FkpA
VKKIIGGVALSLVLLTSCNKEAEKKEITLDSEIDKVSYSLGVTFGNNVKTQGLKEINPDVFAAALEDVFGEKTLRMDNQEASELLQAFFQNLEEGKNAGAIEESKALLAQNGAKETVITTASGLQYEILQEGTGKSPEATSKVTVHYHGTTPDGTVFDSSVDRGEPISFALNQVIKGWTEGVQLMKEGAKYKFTIPENLAYGANPRPGGPIKPYMALVFEVELIKVEG